MTDERERDREDCHVPDEDGSSGGTKDEMMGRCSEMGGRCCGGRDDEEEATTGPFPAE